MIADKKDSSTPVVDAIGEMNFQGTLIDHGWLQSLKLESGRVDIFACLVLGEIVYWYRPLLIHDEATGHIIGKSKRFSADRLQRSYGAFAEKLGMTKRQVKAAIDRLIDYGLIHREFRTVKFLDNVPCSNVLFVEPIPEKIREISIMNIKGLSRKDPPILPQRDTPLTLERNTPPARAEDVYKKDSEEHRKREREETTPVSSIPEELEPDEKTKLHAFNLKIPKEQWQPITDDFLDYCRAEGRFHQDYQAALRRWMSAWKKRNYGSLTVVTKDSPTAEKKEIPYQAIVETYNEVLPMCRPCFKLTNQRKQQLAARWLEKEKYQSIDWWRNFFSYIRDSQFLTGSAPGKDGRNFTASLEWIIKEENFWNILEDKYHDNAA